MESHRYDERRMDHVVMTTMALVWLSESAALGVQPLLVSCRSVVRQHRAVEIQLSRHVHDGSRLLYVYIEAACAVATGSLISRLNREW